jgi:F-type H+-transporting ATPase subunit a
VASGALAKRLLLVTALVLVVLLVTGFIFGAIGSKMFGTPRFIEKPHVQLPPQPVFPASTRHQHLGLSTADGHGSKKEGARPLAMVQFAVTNTLLSAWLASIVMVLFFVLGARRKSLVPGRFQSLVETLVEWVLNFSSAVLGPEMARKAFPVVATIFFFVLFNAWLALLPFYQFLGFIQEGGRFLGFIPEGQIKAHLLRSAGTDLNMPLALALVSFVFVEYWGLRAHGFSYLRKFFALGNLFRGRPAGLIDAFVGFLEAISEVVRVISFTFRLFGNMTAGELLVVMITFLLPFVAIELFFALELLIGLVQAIIFGALTLIFLSVAVRHQEH